MSIEIEVLNGDASWPIAKPLLEAVWPKAEVEKLPWGQVKWANADLRVLVETAGGDLACHVGITTRMATWNNRRMNIGGIGGVATHPGHRRRGYASVALTAAIQTLRDREDVQFAVLFCEPHNEAFYEARGWRRFIGEVWCEQPEGRVRFGAMAPFTFDLKGGAGGGILDLCGLPW